MKFRNPLKQFASTFKEWHYLVSGFSTGFAVGLYVGVVLNLRHND